jgi:hypothetical protein
MGMSVGYQALGEQLAQARWLVMALDAPTV